MSSSERIRVRECACCEVRVLAPRVFCARHWGLLPDSLTQEIGDAVLDRAEVRLAKLIGAARGVIDRLERRGMA